MKKYLKLFIVAGVLAVALTGCGKDKTSPTPTPTPDTTQKQGMVNDDGTKGTLENVFNKTYTIGKEGNMAYGTLFIGNPELSHKTDNGGKAYIEVTIPLKLTNNGKAAIQPLDLLNALTIDSNYNPYQDQLKLMCIETKAIIKGNTDKDDQYYFVGLFDKGLKMENNKPVLEPGQSVNSYFRYIVTTDDIHMDQLKNVKFNDLTLNDFQFIINAKNGDGYTVVK
ncbi:hypothetical protein [uncultured Clostridium sp.]|uniref:hypothetical protein n=1 Tax=uncultured Clostridium sp. TaxID=59620 RepID=UPI002634C407|nr:hypothetical protein [uncultured Clostridium sp.]